MKRSVDGPMKARYLEAISGEGGRLVALARQRPDATVPHYPEWTLRDLAEHTGGILSRTTKVASERVQERVKGETLPPGTDAIDWLERNLSEMVEALAAVGSSEAVWSFLPDGSIAAWERRMTVEIGVHRWDAQQSIEAPEPLLDVVATSGLDEFPDMFLERLGTLPTLRLQATDVDREWTYGPGSATESVSGTASDLYLRLMARPGSELSEEWAAAIDGVPSASA
jgi:uncharacterized protein (TIGR03083 family)